MAIAAAIIALAAVPVRSEPTSEPAASVRSDARPFSASCHEGTTHRYDGSTGLDMLGRTVDSPVSRWSTESWGDVEVSWRGGSTIELGGLTARVSHAGGGIVAAYWTETIGSTKAQPVVESVGTNIYSVVIDTVLGQAVYSQTQAVVLGASRQIKVRSQNLFCDVRPLQ